MNAPSTFAKCSCSHCGGHLEFESAYAGAAIDCPHCGYKTVLYVPGASTTPPVALCQRQPKHNARPSIPSVGRPLRSPDARIPGAPLPAARPRIYYHVAPQAAKASWVSFIFAYFFGAMARKTERSDPGIIWLATALLFLIIGFVLGIIGLCGVRKYGWRGVLIPALFGVTLNGVCLGIGAIVVLAALVHQHRLPQAKMKVAASLTEMVQQITNDGRIVHVPSTGDAQIDGGFRVMAELINESLAEVETMKTELTALNERDVFSVLESSAAIKSELAKRTAAQAIIEKHERKYAVIQESARQKILALRLRKAMEQTALKQLGPGGTYAARVEPQFSIKLRGNKAEQELLRLMLAQFGRYRLVNERVVFNSAAALEEYNRLLQDIRNVQSDAEAIDREREAEARSLPERLRELTR